MGDDRLPRIVGLRPWYSNSQVVIAGKRALLKSGSQNLPFAKVFQWDTDVTLWLYRSRMKPYPCKAAYAAGSRDARVLPSCLHSLDDMSADGYETLRNEALYI